MAEGSNLDVKVYGLPEERHAIIRNEVIKQRAEETIEANKSLIPVELSPIERAQFLDVDMAANAFFVSKLDRLGVPQDKLPDFPPANYVRRPKHVKGDTGGTFHPVSRVVSVYEVNRMSTFFDCLSIIAHEKSHASVGEDIRFYFAENEGENAHANSRGVELVGNHKKLGSAIEEGLVIADETEFFNTFLKVKYPEEYAKRLSWANDYRIRRSKDTLDPEIWGEITPQVIAPFIGQAGPRVLGKTLLPAPILSSPGQLKEYLLIRKLSELIGRDELGEESQADTEEVIQVGRDILDRDRYLRTHDAHRRIVKILGGEKAKALFKFKAHDPNVDEAMALLVQPSSK